MWNPSEKEAKKAFDYASKSPDNYNKMNEAGKRAFWQYGKSKGIFNLNTLGAKAKAEYSKYITDDMPYASDNPIERATLARQSEQGQYDVSDQVKASKTQDRRLLNEARLESLTQKPAQPKPFNAGTKTQIPIGKAGIIKNDLQPKAGNIIPVGKAGLVKTQAREFNGIDAAVLGALDTTTFGAMNIKDDAAIQANNGAFTAGQVLGYIAPGAGLTNAAGKGLAKLGAGKLLQNLGGSAIAGAAIDTGQGLVAGDTGKELAKRVGRGAIIGLAADGALMGLGKIGQSILKKLADKQTLSAAERAAIDGLPDEAKKEIILYVDTYGNVRNKPDTDLLLEAPKQNVPRAKEIKTLTKTTDIKPSNELYLHSTNKQFDKFKPGGDGFVYFSKKDSNRLTQAEKINENWGGGRLIKVNLDKNKLKLFDPFVDKKAKAIVEKYGLPSDRSWIKWDDLPGGLSQDIRNNGYSMVEVLEPNGGYSYAVSDVDAIKMLPDKIGQKLTTNKPILSALDARLNKPQITPGKNIDTPFRLTLAEKAKIDGVKAPVANQKLSGGINSLPIENKSLTGALKAQGEAAATSIKPNAAQTAKEAVEKAPMKKDISGFQAYTTDVYRNFEKVFGDDYAAVKKDILDPFDNAKKAKTLEDRKLMSDLKKNIVDKFNIQKGSKESALIQQFGEKRISYESLVDKVGKAKADNVVAADKWFRSEYDRLIDEVNRAREIVYPNQTDKLIPRRNDYYRHFKELSDDFAGLKNIFDTPSQISPSLAGTSEFTKPKSKFLSFAQKRGNGAFTDDAVGGFLDYINAATYAKHIDTQIPNFRALAADLAEKTEQSKNMNNFIGYLTDFANDLAGKTNPADRFVQKIIPGGRMTFNAINWLNNRVKANTILGNLSSSLSQLANLPQGIAYVKNPVHLSKGAGNFMASIFGKGDADLYKKSGFLLERYADNVARQFDTKILDQPKKAAAWMLGALDEVGSKTIWSSVYQKAVAEGIENPIKYADDITRRLVAGRGIGEVPLLQKSKLMQLFAPFTIEVNNLWKVQKDFIKAKDFGGLVLLYLANFALNKGMEEVRGDGVVFDPIQAIYDATTEKDLKPIERVGRLGGEVLSNMPLGSTLTATLYPEQGVMNEFVSLPTREKLFGRNDPTRFGSGLTVVKGIQDPLYKILPPFAGGQIKKTIQAGQDLALLPKVKKQDGKLLPKLEKQENPASYSNTMKGDRLRTTINPTLPTTLKGLAFGRGAIPELKKYYEAGKVPFSTIQTDNFKNLVDKGYDANKLFNTLNSIRGTTKKNDIVVKLRESGYNSREINEIWEIFYK
jgi:hypothetical protein